MGTALSSVSCLSVKYSTRPTLSNAIACGVVAAVVMFFVSVGNTCEIMDGYSSLATNISLNIRFAVFDNLYETADEMKFISNYLIPKLQSLNISL